MKHGELTNEIRQFIQTHGNDKRLLIGFFHKKLSEVERELHTAYNGQIPKRQRKKFAVMAHNIRHEIDQLGEQ